VNKKVVLISVVGVLLAIVFECLYFQLIYRGQTNSGSACEVVLVYGGYFNRSVEGLALANKTRVPLFISDSFDDTQEVEKKIGPSRVMITVDHFARTTDQNARHAVGFLKKGNFRKAALVTSWYHMPRALFLTRLYLLGSGIAVQPYFFEPIPPLWWAQSEFWIEIIRFWGSLGRAVLAALGFEKPWFHS